MFILKYEIIIAFFLSNTISFSQNLILNGKFEDINICTEYKAPCSPEAWRLTSINLPKFENGKIGIIVFNSSIPNVRSYIQSPLADTLILGEKYRISLDILPGEFPINEIGVVLSDKIINTKNDILLKIKPDIEFFNKKKIMQNNKKWLHLEKEFIAKKQAKYIIIGNFYNDNFLIKKKRKLKQFKNYYYFIDNIKLVSTNNLHDIADLKTVKNNVYSQNKRHPVQTTLFENIFSSKIKLKDTTIFKTDTFLLNKKCFFEFDSYKPTKSIKLKIESIINKLNEPIESIEIIGHTDNIGNNDYNEKLSLKRAKTIKELILKTGIVSSKKIICIGMGDKKPLTTNLTEEGRAKNRRVEVIITYILK